MIIQQRQDSFSTDDEVPLKYCTNGDDQSNSYRNLCQRSVQSCDFCEKVFSNRYESIIHNASHIIIPLLNLKLIKCNDCEIFFTSQSNLLNHIHTKHLICNGNNADKQIDKDTRKEIVPKRIRFEDDEIFNVSDLSEDLTTDCIVTLGLSDQSLISDGTNNINNSDNVHPLLQNIYVFNKHHQDQDDIPEEIEEHNSHNNSISKNNEIEERIKCDLNEHYESVHYNVLRKPKSVKCEHCKMKFPDRYNLVIHEATHIKFNRKLETLLCLNCDWHIAGNRDNLRQHTKTHHPEMLEKTIYPVIKSCLDCGLSYRRYLSHANNYHQLNIEDITYDKTIKVCDLCYAFLKSGQHRTYIKVGTISSVGIRSTCGRCFRKFFELNRVKKTEIMRRKNSKRIKNDKLTNDMRLKNIQHRFKQIKNMRKF